MNIQTRQGHGQAIDRLERRGPEVLAIFIASLALHEGPVGEQVCTFIVGDDLTEAGVQIEGRINSLRRPESRSRHEFGREVGQRLMFILDAIESLVLAKDSQYAFDLLVLVIQSDGHAMENCGDHHFEVSCAMDRAIQLIARVAPTLPRNVVQGTIHSLAESDGYGTRSKLSALLAESG